MTENRKTPAELKELEIELGLRKRSDPDVVMRLSRPRPTEMVTIRIIPPAPPVKCGEYTWWKCTSCPRFYNAPKKSQSGKCVLCQHRWLQRVRG